MIFCYRLVDTCTFKGTVKKLSERTVKELGRIIVVDTNELARLVSEEAAFEELEKSTTLSRIVRLSNTTATKSIGSCKVHSLH